MKKKRLQTCKFHFYKIFEANCYLWLLLIFICTFQISHQWNIICLLIVNFLSFPPHVTRCSVTSLTVLAHMTLRHPHFISNNTPQRCPVCISTGTQMCVCVYSILESWMGWVCCSRAGVCPHEVEKSSGWRPVMFNKQPPHCLKFALCQQNALFLTVMKIQQQVNQQKTLAYSVSRSWQMKDDYILWKEN